MRLCRGPAHEQPVLLPLTSDYWHFRRTGRCAGKPYSPCKACKRLRDCPTGGYLETARVRPWVEELVTRCGSLRAAAAVCGVSTAGLHRIIAGRYARTQRRTATLVLTAVAAQRQADRLAHRTTPTYLRARQAHAWREQKLMRSYL